MSESVSAVVRGVVKEREERGESTREGGGGGDRETRVTVIDRKREEGIIRSQSGSEKNREKER